jgi:iron-sulfur cluster insertion protein
MITVTESAKNKIQALFEEEGTPGLKLRTFVQGGGCSGMQYGFMFDETQNEDDFEVESGGRYLGECSLGNCHPTD